jgi:hypothetical protein
MPYIIRKVRSKKCYSVKNRKSKKIFAKCTSLKKAKKQLRLLNAIEYGGFKPRKNYKRKSRRKSR